mmetsp:Transcript_32036/g.81624  ORF Transcript_32036/g.81624 Transcript_32036/m.81624 type:complete len:631 (+) Transcript_32036:1123-3015(+)
MSMSARLAMEASVCGCRLPSTSRQPASASRLSGSASRSMRTLLVARPRSLRSTPRLLTDSSVSGWRSPSTLRLTASDSRLSGSASSSLPTSESSCESVSMAVIVSGWWSPCAARQPASFSLEYGSASSNLPSWCSSSASVLTASRYFSSRLPSAALRPATSSRQSGSASSSLPCSCCRETTRSSSLELPRASAGTLLSARSAHSSSQPCRWSSSSLPNSSKPPSALWMALSTAALCSGSVASDLARSAMHAPSSAFVTTSMSAASAACICSSSPLGMSTARLASTLKVQCSCHRHHERRRASGSSCCRRSTVVPMDLSPCLKLVAHQSMGMGSAWWSEQKGCSHTYTSSGFSCLAACASAASKTSSMLSVSALHRKAVAGAARGLPASSRLSSRASARASEPWATASRGIITLVAASAAVSPLSSSAKLARKARMHGMETPSASKPASGYRFFSFRLIGSRVPSSRTPMRPLSFCFVTTAPILPLSSGLLTMPSTRTQKPTSLDVTLGGPAGSSAPMPIQLSSRAAAARGAAATACIHRSRCSSQSLPPVSHPLAKPPSTRARSFWPSVSTWNPDSSGLMSEERESGKPSRYSSILDAAAATPPGGAVGSSTFWIFTSNGLAFFVWFVAL